MQFKLSGYQQYTQSVSSFVLDCLGQQVHLHKATKDCQSTRLSSTDNRYVKGRFFSKCPANAVTFLSVMSVPIPTQTLLQSSFLARNTHSRRTSLSKKQYLCPSSALCRPRTLNVRCRAHRRCWNRKTGHEGREPSGRNPCNDLQSR